MSAKKKPKKLRRPNIILPLAAGTPAASRGGGAEAYTPTAARADSRAAFDYTHVIKDMRRIGVLAAICVTFLVVLSFFIR